LLFRVALREPPGALPLAGAVEAWAKFRTSHSGSKVSGACELCKPCGRCCNPGGTPLFLALTFPTGAGLFSFAEEAPYVGSGGYFIYTLRESDTCPVGRGFLIPTRFRRSVVPAKSPTVLSVFGCGLFSGAIRRLRFGRKSCLRHSLKNRPFFGKCRNRANSVGVLIPTRFRRSDTHEAGPREI
jgi:hypothetical protein